MWRILRFSILDAMVVVAVVAAWQGYARRAALPSSNFFFRIAYSRIKLEPIQNTFVVGAHLTVYAAGFVLCSAVGVLAVGIIDRRESAASFGNSPGKLSSLIAILAFTSLLLPFSILQYHTRLAEPEIIKRFLKLGSLLTGAGVCASWITLMACGRWRPAWSLREALGIVIGTYWVISLPFILNDACSRIN